MVFADGGNDLYHTVPCFVHNDGGVLFDFGNSGVAGCKYTQEGIRERDG